MRNGDSSCDVKPRCHELFRLLRSQILGHFVATRLCKAAAKALIALTEFIGSLGLSADKAAVTFLSGFASLVAS
jgi:hypothetical protein